MGPGAALAELPAGSSSAAGDFLEARDLALLTSLKPPDNELDRKALDQAMRAYRQALNLPGADLAKPPAGSTSAAGDPSEAFLEARNQALRESRNYTGDEPALAQAIRAYFQTLDPYSTYLSPSERRFLAANDRPNYSGVGMDILAGPKGEIFCVPYDDSPAHQAGILSGDRLLAVDGQNVRDKAPVSLPALLRGAAGSRVNLTVAGTTGRPRTVTLTRANLNRQAVESVFDGLVLKIRIYRFEAETAEEVKRGLLSQPDHQRVVIDLRGNTGGDLKAAVDTADLFLPAGSLILTVTGRPYSGIKPVEHRATGQSPKFIDSQVVIWQDRLTASASEVFIAALKTRRRAASIGSQTFGKGVSQTLTPASGGGLFILTTGELTPPDGQLFNRKGLAPDLLLRRADHEGDYYNRTEEAFSVFNQLIRTKKP
jgi:carboxyl-terminal processing protease